MKNDCEKQAQEFLTRNGVKFRATLSDSKTPQWGDGAKHGHHYRVTLSKPGKQVVRTYRGQDDGAMKVGPFQYQSHRLTFDFWSSIADMEAGVKTVGAYDVLACISGDAYCPDKFKDFCAEYGYESDSIKALQTFRRVDRFAKRLREFFTAKELEELQEIQ